MIRGIYTAASGLLTNLRRQEAVSNNLANANTIGYKEGAAADTSFGTVLATRVGNALVPVPLTVQKRLGIVGTGAYQSARQAFLRQGTLTNTGEPLDVALVGREFFATRTAAGETLYTSDGHFSTNNAGEIVTAGGRQVLDVNGQPINVAGELVRILRNGEVAVNGNVVASLVVFEITANQLVRADGSAFTAAGTATPLVAGAEPRIEQGQLEQSNIDMADESVRLMNSSRQFEASQRVFRELSANLERAVKEIGRVG
ncbi:MAG: flagellar hook-basal body protein [Dehalococcoidia bacterium]|nr:flagellar hook-basal body protein [Dehalococcoidia bacterium]